MGDLFAGANREGRSQFGLPDCNGLACGRRALPVTTWPTSEFRFLDAGQVGSVGDFCISDEVMPAYPKDPTLAAHVEGLKLP